MRRALFVVVLLVLAGLGAGATADEPGLERMQLRVGQPVLWSPGYPCIMIVCDDPTVVRVEDAQTSLRLTGLRVGSTRCGFWRDKGYRKLVQFDVTR
jgi:hypothetical protein